MAISYKTALTIIGMFAVLMGHTANASALSPGCNLWNHSSNNTDGVIASNQTFAAWETTTVTFTHVSGTSPNNYSYTYTDNINAGNSISKTGSTAIGDTVKLTLQIPADTTQGTLFVRGLGAMYDYTISCVAGYPPAPVSVSSASTTPAVVAAVSRSQTTIIQQNIKSRVLSIANSGSHAIRNDVSTVALGGMAASDTMHTTNDATSLMNGWFDNDQNRFTNSDNGLRRLAMMGSFDSSTGAGLSAFRFGLADHENVGASGVDNRRALYSPSPFTVWGNGSFISTNNDYVNGTADNRYDGDVWGYNVGLDYQFTQALTAGVSVGYNDTDLSTSFNEGSYKERVVVISPYAIYRPLNDLSIVTEFGFGQGNIDVARDNGLVKGSTDSDLWYGALSAFYKIRPAKHLPFSLTPSVAFIASRKVVDEYTESDGRFVDSVRANTRQIKSAVEAAYAFTPTVGLVVTPFVEVGLIHDFTDEINNDKSAFNISGGVRLSDSATGLNAAIEGSYLAGRADYTEYTISGTLAYGFAISDDKGQNLGIVKPFLGSNVDKYGNRFFRGGLGHSFAGINTELILSRMMLKAKSYDDADIRSNFDTSNIMLNLSIPL